MVLSWPERGKDDADLISSSYSAFVVKPVVESEPARSSSRHLPLASRETVILEWIINTGCKYLAEHSPQRSNTQRARSATAAVWGPLRTPPARAPHAHGTRVSWDKPPRTESTNKPSEDKHIQEKFLKKQRMTHHCNIAVSTRSSESRGPDAPGSAQVPGDNAPGSRAPSTTRTDQRGEPAPRGGPHPIAVAQSRAQRGGRGGDQEGVLRAGEEGRAGANVPRTLPLLRPRGQQLLGRHGSLGLPQVAVDGDGVHARR